MALERRWPLAAEAGPTPPPWFSRFGACDWELHGSGQHDGTQRWRGYDPALNAWLHVLVSPDGGKFVSRRVAVEVVRSAIADVGALTWAELERRMAVKLLPGCEVPGCGERGQMVLTAAAVGWFAGRRRAAGDEIRICPRHHHDVLSAQGEWSVGRLPGWLQDDVRSGLSDPPDMWSAKAPNCGSL